MFSALDNLPYAGSLDQGELMVGDDVQHLNCTAFLKGIGADGEHWVSADNMVEQIYLILGEVIPIYFLQPEGVSCQTQAFKSSLLSCRQVPLPILEAPHRERTFQT